VTILKTRTPNGHIRARHVKPTTTVSPAPTPPGIGEVHAGRYPVHNDPAKGQVYNGVCNTTRCDSRRAVWFNRGTYGLYCTTCARGQNGFDAVPVSILVEAKPGIAGMNAHHDEMMAKLSEARAKKAQTV